LLSAARDDIGVAGGNIFDWGAIPPEEAFFKEANLYLNVVPQTGKEALAFWKSSRPAIVMGKGRKAEEDVNVGPAEADGIPIYVRPSGGGTVFLPGARDETGRVLCVTKVLPVQGSDLKGHPIRQLFRTGLKIVVDALESMGVAVKFLGISDIAVGGKKLAGCAQARKRNAVMVHSSILISAPIDEIERYLKHPTDEPDYRRSRSHREFITDVVGETGLTEEKAEAELVERIRMLFLGSISEG
jgi:lipoate-protein ligase A